jgi:2-keto-3-deoxy-L-rhamnonate aldolase RhmA
MRANQLKRKLLRDEVAVALMTLSADLHVVGITAGAGFDGVMPDFEHTSLSLRELEGMVRAADAAGIVPTVRVAGPTKAHILSVLETGVRGIMVPAVESVEEAKQVVQAARYAPLGRRGAYYIGYPSDYCGVPVAEHLRSCNEELLIILQIETRKGIENAAAIAEVPGVDCLLIGPGDLSLSLGVPWEFEHPAMWEAISNTFRVTRLHGKVAGIMPYSAEYGARCVEAGARLLLWGPDLSLFQRAAQEDSARLAETLRWKPAANRPG